MRRFFPFQRYSLPESLEEALMLLEREGPQAFIVAGGTNLLVAMKERGMQADGLVDIKKIDDLRGIRLNDDGRISIGATTTLHEIENHSTIKQSCPVLSRVAGMIGSLQVRNLGTLGGNIANGSPAADTAPVLLVLGAELELISRSTTRLVPVEAFFTGPGQTVLQQGEVLRRILVPIPPTGVKTVYLKFGPRRAMDIAVAGVAVSLILDGDGNCRETKVALGSVAPTPVRARRAEAVLSGVINEDRLEEAAQEAVAETRPIDDVRASASYRKELVRVLLKRAVKQAIRDL